MRGRDVPINAKQLPPGAVTTSLLAASCTASLLFGIIVGFILAGGLRQDVGGTQVAAAAAPAGTPAGPFVNEAELQSYRNVLASDPKNAAAAAALGNKLYDAGRYAEAIVYYQQSFAADPTNVNISTDLGTALWYSGRADEALAQFQKSLAINPGHAQTLFNQGVVRLEGKQDALGAIESWETLLTKNPSYADAEKVRAMLADAQNKVVPSTPVRSSR